MLSNRRQAGREDRIRAEPERIRRGQRREPTEAGGSPRSNAPPVVLRVFGDVLNGAESAGYLCLHVGPPPPDGAAVAVRLTPAQVETLVMLVRVREQDDRHAEEARGWCQTGELARLRFVEIENQRRVISQIRGRIRTAIRKTSEAIPILEILETQRRVGVRLITPLVIERLDQRLVGT